MLLFCPFPTFPKIIYNKTDKPRVLQYALINEMSFAIKIAYYLTRVTYKPLDFI